MREERGLRVFESGVLRVFESGVLRETFGLKRDGVTGNGEDHIARIFMICIPD